MKVKKTIYFVCSSWKCFLKWNKEKSVIIIDEFKKIITQKLLVTPALVESVSQKDENIS